MPEWLRSLIDPTWRWDEELDRDEAELEALRQLLDEPIPPNVIPLSDYRRRQRPSRRA